MKIRLISFNINLLLIILFLTGCATPEEKSVEQKSSATKPQTAPPKNDKARQQKKEWATIRFHLETNLDGTEKTRIVPVHRASPIYVTVEEMVFLSEADVERAAVTDWAGTYAIQVQFNHHGAFVLDTMTTSNKRRRLAIFSEFG